MSKLSGNGRRRMGKTALLTQFIQDKKVIYFMGVESNAKQNLENLSKSILEYASSITAATSFISFQAALEYVFKLAEKERVHCYLFSKSGFTKGCIEKANELGNVTLVGYEDVLRSYGA